MLLEETTDNSKIIHILLPREKLKRIKHLYYLYFKLRQAHYRNIKNLILAVIDRDNKIQNYFLKRGWAQACKKQTITTLHKFLQSIKKVEIFQTHSIKCCAQILKLKMSKTQKGNL